MGRPEIPSTGLQHLFFSNTLIQLLRPAVSMQVRVRHAPFSVASRKYLETPQALAWIASQAPDFTVQVKGLVENDSDPSPAESQADISGVDNEREDEREDCRSIDKASEIREQESDRLNRANTAAYGLPLSLDGASDPLTLENDATTPVQDTLESPTTAAEETSDGKTPLEAARADVGDIAVVGKEKDVFNVEAELSPLALSDRGSDAELAAATADTEHHKLVAENTGNRKVRRAAAAAVALDFSRALYELEPLDSFPVDEVVDEEDRGASSQREGTDGGGVAATMPNSAGAVALPEVPESAFRDTDYKADGSGGGGGVPVGSDQCGAKFAFDNSADSGNPNREEESALESKFSAAATTTRPTEFCGGGAGDNPTTELANMPFGTVVLEAMQWTLVDEETPPPMDPVDQCDILSRGSSSTGAGAGVKGVEEPGAGSDWVEAGARRAALLGVALGGRMKLPDNVRVSLITYLWTKTCNIKRADLGFAAIVEVDEIEQGTQCGVIP